MSGDAENREWEWTDESETAIRVMKMCGDEVVVPLGPKARHFPAYVARTHNARFPLCKACSLNGSGALAEVANQLAGLLPLSGTRAQVLWAELVRQRAREGGMTETESAERDSSYWIKRAPEFGLGRKGHE